MAPKLTTSNGQIGLPSIHGLYYLIDGHTGQPLATMDGARMTVWRTAAASALAAVTALATTVASLKTLITTLTNLVLKIQKKVKA